MSRFDINKLNRKSRIGDIVYNHIMNNKREYLIITILFFIGLIIGVFFINNLDDNQTQRIHTYFNELANNINENIDFDSLFKKSILSNVLTIILLWFGASTIIGILVVYGTVVVKGFSIGYTISSIIACFGIGKGILLNLSIMLLHNIVFIPTIFATSVSGLRLYKSIMKNNNTKNIKIEILRHTLFSIIMLVLIIISSVIEIYLSTKLFILVLRNI